MTRTLSGHSHLRNFKTRLCPYFGTLNLWSTRYSGLEDGQDFPWSLFNLCSVSLEFSYLLSLSLPIFLSLSLSLAQQGKLRGESSHVQDSREVEKAAVEEGPLGSDVTGNKYLLPKCGALFVKMTYRLGILINKGHTHGTESVIRCSILHKRTRVTEGPLNHHTTKNSSHLVLSPNLVLTS